MSWRSHVLSNFVWTVASMAGTLQLLSFHLQDSTFERVNQWAEATRMDKEKSVTVVKPAIGSAGRQIQHCVGLHETLAAVARQYNTGWPGEIVVEPKVLGAVEFSVCVMQVRCACMRRMCP
jgi:hypothetical protein